MPYKVIALDLDGTLTNSQKKITEKTKKALFKAQESGLKVVLASGRPIQGVLPIAKELRLGDYGGCLLAFNGARAVDCQTGQTLWDEALPGGVLKEVYREAIRWQAGIITYEEGAVLSGNGVDAYVQLEADINKLPLKEVPDFGQYVDFPVNKCLLTGEGSHMAQVEKAFAAQFGDQLSIYRSEPFYVEIMPKGVDKASSLGKLLKRGGYRREELICCGDGFNDISMISYAGLGVAMANAQDRVKEAADFVTKSNDEDGIAYVVEKFALTY